MTFKKYVEDWWGDCFTKCREDGEYFLKSVVGNAFDISDAENIDYSLVYETLLSDDHEFIEKMLSDVCEEIGYSKYSFAEDFIEDIAYHISQYEQPDSFFDDLQHGGCVSGMIGMFIYHSDCKDFYIKNIDDLEDFVMELEDEFGEPVKNRDRQPRYTFVCWLCYEEFAYRIARELFPNNF